MSSQVEATRSKCGPDALRLKPWPSCGHQWPLEFAGDVTVSSANLSSHMGACPGPLHIHATSRACGLTLIVSCSAAQSYLLAAYSSVHLILHSYWYLCYCVLYLVWEWGMLGPTEKRILGHRAIISSYTVLSLHTQV